MRRQSLPGLVLAAVLCLPALAQAFYCGEQLIELNAAEDQVLGKCGVPDWSETWEEELLQRATDEAFDRSVSVNHAEWIYDLGPNRLIRILGFRDGVLKSIDTRPYAPAPNGDCSARIVEIGEGANGPSVARTPRLDPIGEGAVGPSVARTPRLDPIGDTKFEVLRKCGQPATRKQVTEKRMEPLDPVLRRRYAVTVERWTYRGKGDALLRTVVFRNRRVIDVESGSNS